MAKRKYEWNDFCGDATIKCDHCEFKESDKFENVKKWEGIECSNCGEVMVLPGDVLVWATVKLALTIQASVLNLLPGAISKKIFDNRKNTLLDTGDMVKR